MPYNIKEFRRSKTHSGKLYQSRPTGLPDIGRLIRGLTYWLNPLPPKKEKNKTLILADWSADSWSGQKIDEVLAALKILMTPGKNGSEDAFDIYIWQSGALVQLTHENLSCLNELAVRKGMTPPSIEVVAAEAQKQLKRARDDIHVVDDYWVNYILSEDEKPQPRGVNFCAIAHILSSAKKDLVLQLMQHAIPPVEEIIIDSFPPGYREMFAKIFPNKPIKKKYTQAKLNRDEVISLLAGNTIVESTKTGLSFNFNSDDLAKLDTLAIECTILSAKERVSLSYAQLHNLFQLTPQIKKLSLSRLEDMEIPIDRLHNLEQLILDNALISFANLQTLLKNAAHLKEVSLTNCANLTDSITLSSEFPQLKELNLYSSSIGLDNLGTLLKAAPYLRKLSLVTCELTNILNLEANSLLNLEEINLNASTISSENLQILLKAAPKLKKINLGQCTKLTEPLVFEPKNMAQLEELFLTGSNIALDEVQTVLKNAPHLKRLNLSKCTNLTGTLSDLGDLLRLEDLFLSESSISLTNVHTLLKATPNLKKISVSLQPDAADTLLRLDTKLLKLNEIEFSSKTPISFNNIQVLLKAAPNLRKVTFANCKLSDTLTLDEGSLPYVEEMDLNSSTLSLPNLESLLKATPNLRTINLSDCRLTGALTLVPSSLLQLEEINLEATDISLANLQSILKAAPNLKRIYLNSCKKLGGRLILDVDSLPQLETVGLSASISPMSLKVLLDAAPQMDRDALLQEHTMLVKADRATFGSIFSSSRAAGTGPTKIGADKNSHYVDANTRPQSGQSFHVEELFHPLGHSTAIKVPHYRLETFQRVGLNPVPCTPSEAFYQEKEKSLDLTSLTSISCNPKKSIEPTDVTGAEHYSLYRGRQNLILNEEWQPLASLSPHEMLLRYSIIPSEVDADIMYSLRDNQYYIRAKKGQREQTIEIDFTIGIPKKEPTLPKEIQDIVNEFLAFGVGELSLDPSKTYTGEQYLNEIMKQKKGACRHRAIAFKMEMAKKFPYTVAVRIVENDCHAFVEVQVNGHWHHCDLGGYPARLHIKPMVEPGEAPKPIIHSALHHEGPVVHAEVLPDVHRALQTWSRDSTLPMDLLTYAQQCFAQGQIKKRLIECSSKDEVNALSIALQSYANTTSRPVFYVNSPDDLICAAPYVDDSGALQKGPGGPLYRFLTANPNGVLIVNYDRFDAEELVRFNTLLDKDRQIDGVHLPEAITVLGLININKPGCYQGADFYSRFDVAERCPLSEEQWRPTLPSLPKDTDPKTTSAYSINLFGAQDWQEQLLGHWVFDDKGMLQFQKGVLQRAFEEKKATIEIQNGLWDNADFVVFWQSALALGYIEHEGRRIALPEGFSLARHEGYDWTSLASALSQASTTPILALNPSTLTTFFNDFIINEKQQFISIPGHIAAATERKELAVYVTRTLTEDAWARLLSECQIHGVTLSIQCAPGVSLPTELSHVTSAPHEETLPLWTQKRPLLTTQVIQSTDADTTVAQLTATDKEWLVLDATELHDPDLLKRVKGELDTTSLTFVFNEEESILTQALQANKRIILKGNFTPELADELATFILERQHNNSAPGTLILVNEANTTAYANPSIHRVTPEEKKAALATTEAISVALEPYLEHESLSQLQCRRNHLLAHPGASTEEAWIGLSTAPKGMDALTPLNPETSPGEAKAFMEARLHATEKVLAHQPYVFLSGLSGVGKTTFVQRTLCKESDTLFQGEKALEEWAKAGTGTEGRQILFLDEATLSLSEWRLFEGLFATPPGILINGQYYPLTEHHKVVFAGNPVSYGDERQLASFFARHGNSVWFDTLPLAVLYEDLLKPTLAGTPLADKAALISKPLLKVYAFLAERSTTDVLISPRELQMMALMVLSYSKQFPSLDDETLSLIATHYAYTIATPLVPIKNRDAFNKTCQPAAPLPQAPSSSVSPTELDFINTSSRAPIRQFLDELLALRTLRQEATNPALLYGGLGGLLLEGEPGVGKSELVIAALRAHGFVEQRDVDHSPSSDKVFYRMPVSWSVEEKTKLLLKAFDEGAVVIIDELNSSPMMEQLLNDLLMGHYQGRAPKTPGFMVIGTQNPTTMAGRRVQSTALSRRLTTLEVPPYTAAEITSILEAKGLPLQLATNVAYTYQEQVQFAKLHRLTPVPTFRDLIKVANALVHETELAKAREVELARAREAELAKAREAELARAREAELARAREAELARARNAELARAREAELAREHEAELARKHEAELARAREDELAKAREDELANSMAITTDTESLHRTSSYTLFKRQSGPAPDHKPLAALVQKYFGADGLAPKYLDERHRTYWFQDLSSQYLALVLSCFGVKSAQTARTNYLQELKNYAQIYSNEPSVENKKQLNDFIEKGIKEFPARAQIDKPGYEQSLHALLTKFKTEINESLRSEEYSHRKLN